VYKGRDLVTENNKAIHPLPSTDHFFATNSHLFSTNPPRTPKKKNKNRMNTMIKLLGKNKAG
jgi:hypothetical protein